MAESVLFHTSTLSIFYDPAAASSVEMLTTTIESILCRPAFEGSSPATNSPVLGIPRSIYWLILDISRLCRKHPRTTEDIRELRRLDRGLRTWENALRASNSMQSDETHFDGMASLYIYCARLLLTWIDAADEAVPSNQEPVWKCLQEVIANLRHTDESMGVARRFLLRWPLLILGHAVTNEDEINLLEEVLKNIWETSKWGDVKMTWQKVKGMWRHQHGINLSKRQRLHLLLQTSL
ncbi:hypothetical protein A1O1_05008 [Capronia coronata CBS 617.96]|uniref:Uncharacterized protein n=1 Tax=Capronia coronata CBS 617.96 TaxID=1182541 RepID=W9YEI4_9EURO|nr:uncharacterized protein A1O1_05008 [Capronia coronata CBS 617.96]EXJ88080.1 hypothetical protein A1O1_05008 [Capronia coronata CBS 617.96]